MLSKRGDILIASGDDRDLGRPSTHLRLIVDAVAGCNDSLGTRKPTCTDEVTMWRLNGKRTDHSPRRQIGIEYPDSLVLAKNSLESAVREFANSESPFCHARSFCR